MLEIIWKTERMLAEISGMSRVSLQTSGGSEAIWANISMIRAYHESRGEGEQRDEVITTIFSHPSNAAAAKAAGYTVITIHPDADGYPDLDALRAALSPRTAAIMVTNPEDTGIYNPRIGEWVRAGARGRRARVVRPGERERHPRASPVPATPGSTSATSTCTRRSARRTAAAAPAPARTRSRRSSRRSCPAPSSRRDGDRYYLDADRPQSIGSVAPFYGVIPNIVRTYAWISALGAEGLRAVAETAVLNNNYLMKRILEIPGASAPYATGRRRIEQVRYSWQELFEETGISSEEIGVRAADFGMHYWTSHHPYVVPQPFTLEPTESYSMAELDEYARCAGRDRPRSAGDAGDRAHRTAQPDRAPHPPRRPGRPGALGGDLARVPAQVLR